MNKTVVFVDTGFSPTDRDVFSSRIGCEEIGAQLVAACCQNIGWSVRFLRSNSTNPEEIASMIRRGVYDVLVFFPYTYTKWLADKVALLFKGDIPIIYGGYHVGVGRKEAEEALKEGIADYVILGRGETSLPWLLQELAIRRVPSQVVHREALFPEDSPYPLDSLPWSFRQRDLMQDLKRHPLPFKPPVTLEPRPRKCVIIAGAIGCAARCDYCTSWAICPKVLHRSPKNIVNEMLWLKSEYGPGLIYHFSNPLFNADKDWVMALCAEMEKRGPFPSISMPDFLLDWEMVQAMKRAGFYFLMMGLEFASNRTRTQRGKREGDPATAYNLCAEAGIVTRAFFMLGRRPRTLETTLEELDDEIRQLEGFAFRADELRANFEVPFPGTLVGRRISPQDVIVDYPRWTTEEVVYRTGLTPEQWQEKRRELLRSYHFSARQKEHYERQIARFPELKEVYCDFLTRLEASLST